jgi:hypothetical protein
VTLTLALFTPPPGDGIPAEIASLIDVSTTPPRYSPQAAQLDAEIIAVGNLVRSYRTVKALQ